MVRTDWVRSKDGILAGVCSGIAKHLQLEPWLVRFVWTFAVLFLGAGAFLYILLAICLPREDHPEKAREKKILGVCLRLAERADADIGLVRFLALLLLFASFGWAVFAYIVLYFALPADHSQLGNGREQS